MPAAKSAGGGCYREPTSCGTRRARRPPERFPAGRSRMGLIAFLVIGLVAGFIARFLVPGPDPMGWLGTLVLGLIGSFVGRAPAAALFRGPLRGAAAGRRASRPR